ncbi:phage tail spike protein [Bacillus cereus]|nr:phage tail spike protein [Bacillus cereus]
MFIDIKRDLRPKKPKLYLGQPNMRIISHIYEAKGIQYTPRLGDLNELTFSIPYSVDDNHRLIDNVHIDAIKERMLIKFVLGGYVEWFIIDSISESADDSSAFNVHAFSLGFELADKRIREFEEETKNPREISDILLSNSVWSVRNIDAAIEKKYRAFEFSATTALDAIRQVAETFEAVIIWNTEERTLDLVHIDKVGEDKGLTINYGKYLKSISRERTTDEMVTRLYLYGSEDLTIHNVNPLGTGFLEDYSFFIYPFQRDSKKNVIQSSYYMSDDLCHAILDYNEKVTKAEPQIKLILENKKLASMNLASEESTLSLLQTDLGVVEGQLDVAKASDNKGLIEKLQKDYDAKKAQVAAQEKKVAAAKIAQTNVDTEIEQTMSKLSIESNFTKVQIKERDLFAIEKEWSDDKFIDAYDLYEEGKKQFEELRKPKVVINISIVNFLEIIEEQHNWDKLVLGDRIGIKYPQMSINSKATIMEMSFDFEAGSVSLTIANTANVDDEQDKLIKLLYKSSYTSATVDMKKHKWNKADELQGKIDAMMNEEWDATQRQINAGVKNSVNISGRGIIIRNPDFPNDVLIAQSGVLALSRDNGKTWKTAIKPTGIVAERLMGQIVAGQNLEMVNEAGLFKFDKNGVEIDAKAFKVRTGNGSINMVEKWTSTTDFFNDFTDDNKLSEYEKKRTKEEWDKISENYKNTIAQADKLFDKKNLLPEYKELEQKYQDLNKYLFIDKVNGKALLADDNMNETSTIVRAVFNSKFVNYTRAEEKLRNKLIDKLQENITDVTFELGEDRIVAKVANSKTFKDVVTNAEALAKRLNTAEQKITDDSIVSTVTKSNEFKKKANADDVFSKGEIELLSSNNMIHGTEFETLDKFEVTKATDRSVTIDRDVKYEGSNSVKVSAKNQTTNSFTTITSEFISCKEGQEFTASTHHYVVKNDLDAGGKIAIQYYEGDKYLTETQQDFQKIEDNKWQRTAIRGKVPAKATKLRITLSVRKNGTMWFARPMLQIGKILTSWTPHVDELATELNSMIEQVAGKISLVVTEKNLINGEAITSSIVQTARAIEMLSERINLKGKVTFESFDSDLKKTFNADGTFNLTRATGKLDEKFIANAEKWNKASGDANSATSKLLEMIQDNKLTPTEKKSVKREFESLLAEKPSMVANADYYKVTQDKTRYEDAIKGLSDYLAPIIKDLTTTSEIVGQTMRDNFKLVYDRRATLQRVLSTKAKELADNAQGSANNAQKDADGALGKLGEMADDNKITAIEKQSVKKEWDIIVAEKPTIEAQANQYGISGEKTNYVNAYNALNTYITPIISNLTTTTVIKGVDFRNNFKAYYDAKVKLLKAVSDKAKSLADGAKNAADDAKKAADDAKEQIKNANLKLVQDRKSWDAAYERVDQWTAKGTTEFDGGQMKNDSIISNKIAVGNWDNLFSNGTMEYGNQGFTGNTFEIVNDPANAHQGNHYLRIKWNGQFNDIYDSKPMKVIEGEQYFLEGQARLLSGSDTTRTFIVQLLDKAGKVVNHLIGSEALNTTWKQVSWTVTIPKGVVAMRIGVSVGGEKNANNYTMFDSLFCKRMSEGKLIVDGTIQAKHLAAESITTDKLTVGEGEVQEGNIARGKPVTGFTPVPANSGTTPTNGNNKVDYNVFSQFGSGNQSNNGAEGSYIEIDLGKTYRISESRAFFYTGGKRFYWYKIKYSTDKTNWNYAVGKSGNKGWVTSVSEEESGNKEYNPTIDNFTPAISARYLRLYANGNVFNNGNHIYEWELYCARQVKVHGGHVEAETLDVRSLKAGKIDANRVSIENDKVKLDSRGVTVSDADFLLKDAYTDSIYSVVPRSNLIPDHSFEFMTPNGTVPDVDSTFTIQNSPFWKQLGAPRLEIDTGDYTNRPHLFGSKAIKVNSSHWVRGVLEAPTIAQGRTYTFSAFARCASDGGKLVQGYPNIRIQFADKNGKALTEMSGHQFAQTKLDGSINRSSYTFTVPKNLPYGFQLYLDIFGVGWVTFDGAQLVEGTVASIYNPDDSLVHLKNGRLPFEEVAVATAGTIGHLGDDLTYESKGNEHMFSARYKYLGGFKRYDYPAMVVGESMIKDYTGGNVMEFKRSTDNAFKNVLANDYLRPSLSKWKTNIKEYEKSALDKICDTPVYTYDMIDFSRHTCQPPKKLQHLDVYNSSILTTGANQLGLVVEESPHEIVRDDRSISSYAVEAMLWKGTQELNKKVKSLEEENESLKSTLNDVLERLVKLEEKVA